MVEKIAKRHGLFVKRTPVGFKYIGNLIAESPEAFLFGFEESNGYLMGSYAKDKDGVAAAFAVVQMAAHYKAQGSDLLEVLDEIHRMYGYILDRTVSIEIADMAELNAIMAEFRSEVCVCNEFSDVCNYTDYRTEQYDPLLAGAENVASDTAWNDRLLEYAVVRNVLRNRGKLIEIFEYFEANLRYFGEWLKQLFAESEGKDGKGTYPASLCFSTDLHSIGQFLQQGNQIFYETLIRVENSKHDFVIPKSAGNRYAGHMLEEINACSENGVILAHTKAGIPMITVQIDRPDEYNMGQMIYFFEMSCAISAYMLGVNPFNQPGVEAYKEETKRLLENLGVNLKKP